MDSGSARWADAVADGLRAGAGLALSRPERVTGAVGDSLGTGLGQSVEFMDFRDYEPGDDTRRVDWAVFGRTDRVMIRRHREDISPRADVVLDASRSMDLAGSPKAATALALGAALERASLRAGYRTAVWKSTEHHRLDGAELKRWTGFNARTSNPFAAPARRAGPRLGVRIIISDLLFPGDLGALVRQSAAAARWVIIAHILARADIRAPDPGALRLEDRETGRTLDVHIDADIAGAFTARADRYLLSCRDACRAVRATYIRLIAEEAPDPSDVIAPFIRAGVVRPK